MSQKRTKIVRLILIISIGLMAFGGKLFLDYSSKSVVIYSNMPSISVTNAHDSMPADTSISSSVITKVSPNLIQSSVSASEENQEIPVYICGAVEVPGIYQVHRNIYLYEVIDLAGGLLPVAAKEYINLVLPIKEAISIYIPTGSDMEDYISGSTNTSSEYLRNGLIQGIWGQQSDTSGLATSPNPGEVALSKVNINSADQQALETLPGVGTATAKAIISYRDANGLFKQIEDIMKVPGIKQGRFDALKDLIEI